MKHGFIIAAMTALFAGCSGTPTPRVLDAVQIRSIEQDDPLAAQFQDKEGNVIRLGDVIVGDQAMNTLFMKKGDDGRFDLNIYLTEYGAGKWRRLIRSGNRNVALLIKGRIQTVFLPAEALNKPGTHIVIPGIGDTQSEADRLEAVFDKKRPVQ